MPASDYIKRLMLDTIASNINEMVIGFDGTPATASDGAAGRPAITLTPVITVIDDSTLMVEANLGTEHSFSEPLKEVFIQFRGSDDFTPVSRHVIRPVTKTSGNEVKIQLLIEVR
tara:strand:+ start:874 stop:1218 length:345 start_codon:yes stop_codon:yes gene_type:complete